MSGGSTSTTPSKLVPIAARPKSLNSKGSASLNRNGITTVNNNSTIPKSNAATRKIAPRPEDAPKISTPTCTESAKNPVPISMMPKIAPRPAPKEGQKEMQPGTTIPIQNLREAVDAAADHRIPAAVFQTVPRLSAPVPIAPRPIIATATTSNLGNVNSPVSGSGPGTPQANTPSSSNAIAAALNQPPKKQILPKPAEKKPQQANMNNPQIQVPVSQFMNNNFIRVLNPNTAFGLSGNGQAPQMSPAFGIPMANTGYRLQYSPSNQQQALQHLQMSYLFQQHQQNQQNINQQNFNNSIFPINQTGTFFQQMPTQQLAGTSIASSNGNTGPLFMISNPQAPTSQVLPPNIMAQLQARQQIRLPNGNLAMQNAVFAKPTIISSIPQNAANGNQVILRPRFLVPASTLPAMPGPSQPPSVVSEAEAVDKKEEENGSDDDENEPPPLLMRDEAMPTDVNEIFIQEAVAARRLRPAEPVRHVVDGFVIEESDVPFELDPTKVNPLEALKRVHDEEARAEAELNPVVAEKMDTTQSPAKTVELTPTRNSTPAKRGRRSTSSISVAEPRRTSSTKSTKSPAVSDAGDRPRSAKKSRELAGLLQMDFGPGKTPFPTTSPLEYAKEIHKQQTALRPSAQVMHYLDDDVEAFGADVGTFAGSSDSCQGCFKTFVELGRRYNKYPQYCSRDCRRQYKLSRKNKKRSNDSLDSSLNDSTESPKKLKMRISTDEIVTTSLGFLAPEENASTSTSHPPVLKQEVNTLMPSRPPTVVQTPPSSSNSSAPDYQASLKLANLNPGDAVNWGPEEVEKFVNCITNSTTNGSAFLREEIDGGSLLFLNDAHLQVLGLKMGPSLKMSKAIEWLKNHN